MGLAVDLGKLPGLGIIDIIIVIVFGAVVGVYTSIQLNQKESLAWKLQHMGLSSATCMQYARNSVLVYYYFPQPSIADVRSSLGLKNASKQLYYSNRSS